jgi:hypothetical protein
MTDYIVITDSQTDPEAPLTSELAKQWRDNPIAIAEGSVGAPKVTGEALSIYINDIALTSTYTNVGTLGSRLKKLRLSVQANATNSSTSTTGSFSIQIRVSNDGGATYSGNISVANLSGIGLNGGSAFTSGLVYLDLVSGAWRSTAGQTAGSGTSLTNINRVEVRLNQSQGSLSMNGNLIAEGGGGITP